MCSKVELSTGDAKDSKLELSTECAMCFKIELRVFNVSDVE